MSAPPLRSESTLCTGPKRQVCKVLLTRRVSTGDPEILECAAEVQRCIATIMSEPLLQDPQAYKVLAARAATLWHRLCERSMNGVVYTRCALQLVLRSALVHGQNAAGVSSSESRVVCLELEVDIDVPAECIWELGIYLHECAVERDQISQSSPSVTKARYMAHVQIMRKMYG